MSITDKFQHHITVEDQRYKRALEAMFIESLQDLRDRNKELRENLAMAKAQIELAQSENRRMTTLFEQLAERHQREVKRTAALSSEVKKLSGQTAADVDEDGAEAHGA
jgi:alkylation response protein AidB-like acyl-CoA dehydrogenase